MSDNIIYVNIKDLDMFKVILFELIVINDITSSQLVIYIKNNNYLHILITTSCHVNKLIVDFIFTHLH